MWKEARVHAGLLTVALIYGANYSVAKFVMPDYVQPFALILLRVSLACLCFLALQLFIKSEKIDKKDWWRLIACGFFGVAVNQLFFFKGLSLTSPIHASVLMLVTPILVLAGAAFVLKEKIKLVRWIGIALGITGATLLVLSAGKADAVASIKGDVMVFINAASYATYLILAKPLLQRYSALTVSFYTFLFALPIVIPFGLPELSAINWAQLPLPVWLSVFFIVFFVTVVAYLLNAWTMTHVSPGVVGSYIYLQPVLAGLIAIALGQDSLSWQKVIFILLIFAGVYLSRSKVKR